MPFLKTSNQLPHRSGGPPKRRPFPNTATFIGIAIGMIVLWLLAGGISQILGWPAQGPGERPEPSHTTEAGASR